MTAYNSKKNKPALKTRRKKKVVRPGVFIEAGVHGREWITPAVATWILKELIKYNNTEGNAKLFFRINIHSDILLQFQRFFFFF